MNDSGIQLSVVVRIVGGGVFLKRCLNQLIPQVENQPIEVIVPYDSAVEGVQTLERLFPRVIFFDMGAVKVENSHNSLVAAHQLYDRRAAAGLRAARGEIVALIEDYGVPDADWCRQVLRAHHLPYGVIGGAVEHSGRGILNWAVYLLDFGRYRLPLREGPTNYLTDVNVSYKRATLESVRELWVDRYNEVTVHWALAEQGTVLWQGPQIVVSEDRGSLSFRLLLAERFAWGRVFGYMRIRNISFLSHLLYLFSSPLLPFVMLYRISRKISSGGRDRLRFGLALPAMIVLATAWCCGEFTAYLTGQELPVRISQPLGSAGTNH